MEITSMKSNGARCTLALLEDKKIEGADKMSGYGILLTNLAPKKFRPISRGFVSVDLFKSIFTKELSALEARNLIKITNKKEIKNKKCRYEITKAGKKEVTKFKKTGGRAVELVKKLGNYYADKPTIEMESDMYLLFPTLTPRFESLDGIRANLLARKYSGLEVKFPFTDRTVNLDSFLTIISDTFFDYEDDGPFIEKLAAKLGLDVEKYIPKFEGKFEDILAIKDPKKRMPIEDFLAIIESR